MDGFVINTTVSAKPRLESANYDTKQTMTNEMGFGAHDEIEELHDEEEQEDADKFCQPEQWEEAVEKDRPPFKSYLSIVAGETVAQIEWAIQYVFFTPMLLRLGASPEVASISWIFAPVLALPLGPWIGRRSDTCTLALGKRRPFLIVTTAIITACLVIIPLTDEFLSSQSVAAIAILMMANAILDISNNLQDQLIRSLATDLVENPQYQTRMHSWISTSVGLGNVVGGVMGTIDYSGLTDQLNSETIVFLLTAIVFSVSSVLMMILADEQALVVVVEEEVREDDEENMATPGSDTVLQAAALVAADYESNDSFQVPPPPPSAISPLGHSRKSPYQTSRKSPLQSSRKSPLQSSMRQSSLRTIKQVDMMEEVSENGALDVSNKSGNDSAHTRISVSGRSTPHRSPISTQRKGLSPASSFRLNDSRGSNGSRGRRQRGSFWSRSFGLAFANDGHQHQRQRATSVPGVGSSKTLTANPMMEKSSRRVTVNFASIDECVLRRNSYLRAARSRRPPKRKTFAPSSVSRRAPSLLMHQHMMEAEWLSQPSLGAIEEDTERKDEEGSGDDETTFRSIQKLLKKSQKSFQYMCAVQFVAYMGLWPVFIYTTSYFASNVYNGDPSADPLSEDGERYSAGVRRGAIASVTLSVVTMVTSPLLPSIIDRLGIRTTFVLSQLLTGASTMMAYFFQGAVVSVFLVGAAGFSWAANNSIPYVYVGYAVPADDVGLATSVVFLFQTLPVFVVAASFGSMIRVAGDDYALPFLVAGDFFILAAILGWLVPAPKVKAKKQQSNIGT